jgi:hypothetical protein
MLLFPPWAKGESRPTNNSLHMTLKMARISTAGDGPVFCILRSKPYHNFRTAFERAVRKAGIVDFTFHDLPYTLASA